MSAPAGRVVPIVFTLAAVALAAAAPVVYVASLDVPFLRRSGLVLFALLILAMACVGRARSLQAPLSRVAVVVVFAITLWTAWLFFVKARLPVEHAPAVGAPAPSFVAAAYDGSSFDLAAARRSGPILLVFFRGFW